MLKKALQFSSPVSLLSTPSFSFYVPYKTTKRISLLSDDDLFNRTYVKKLVNSSFPGVDSRSQRGLFHGAKTRSGERTCFSEKKSKHLFLPNVFKETYYSEILQRKFLINVSTKAKKTIRKYGGFDNYILLAKPDKMQSMFGEYLRRLMYKKLNEPDFDTANGAVFGAFSLQRGRNKRKNIFRHSTYNKETRHKDLSAVNPDFLTEMTKKERRLVGL